MFHSYRELAAQRVTGQTRFRRTWLGRDVLQVEVKSPMPLYPDPPPAPGRQIDIWAKGSYTFWRDATAADHLIAVGPSGAVTVHVGDHKALIEQINAALRDGHKLAL